MGKLRQHFPVAEDHQVFSGLDILPTPTCESCEAMAEADHRIANHLAMLGGLIRLRAADAARQAGEPSRDSVRLMLEGLGLQIDAISRLHRMLANHGSAAPANLSAHLHEICAPFASGVFGPILLVEDLSPDCMAPADQILPLTQMVAEVLTNAVKHACDDGGPGGILILVRCRRDESGLSIEVADSGTGLPPAFDPEAHGGLGFRLLRALSKQVGGTMTFESTTGGLRFRLTLPPTAA